MTNDIGTLNELGVKEGDVVEMLTNNDPDFIGEHLTIQHDGRAKRKGVGLFSPTLDGAFSRTYRVISRASEEPKTWGHMTDEEKGALLLAKHEGKVIEWLDTGGCPDNWMECPAFGNHMSKMILGFAYRIKPDPVVETVVMYASDKMKGFGLCRGDKSVHKLTFKTFDGEIDYKTAKMGKL